MPDYEIDNERKEVEVRIYDNTINERYTKLLKENSNLTLHLLPQPSPTAPQGRWRRDDDTPMAATSTLRVCVDVS